MAIAMPPMARASQRIRYSKKIRAPPPPPPERDWAELHPDLISCILHRLDLAELLIGGVAGVCRSWRRAAREEPELWRRIDLREGLWYVPPFRPTSSVNAMVRKALRLGAGQTEAFLSEGVNNHTLLLLAERAPLLKSLHLISCSVSTHGFAKAIQMLPLLEELEISLCSYIQFIHTREMVELVAGTCLHLKHFRLVMHVDYGNMRSSDGVAPMVARMHKLRSLHLVRLKLNNEELATILDSCHNLEYLNMRYYSPRYMDDVDDSLDMDDMDDSLDVDDMDNSLDMDDRLAMDGSLDMDHMDDNLRVKLAQINVDNHEYSSDHHVDYEFMIRRIYYRHNWHELRHGWFSYHLDYNDDYEEYCYYNGSGDGIDDDDLEEYEKILDIKSMRRYLS